MSPNYYLAKGEAGNGMPAGTVAIWPSSSVIPADWLECNGQYAGTTELYNAIGSYYTPNYQGMFLRGYGNQNFSQNNGSKIGITSTTYSSGSLGSIQGDAIRNIKGTFIIRASRKGDSVLADNMLVTKNFVTKDANVFELIESSKMIIEEIAFDTSKVIPTATENRPINKAVKYIIKIR